MKLRRLKDQSYQRISTGRDEVLHKNRGYGVINIECHGLIFAVPLRSNLEHKSGFKTVYNNKKWNGIDYSKALVVTDNDLESEAFKPRRTDEYLKIQNNKLKIQQEFVDYVDAYIAYIKSGDTKIPYVFKYTTLQYFHLELNL